jgi:hypothetical protein
LLRNLKLAPRQVQALEDGDYGHLPGRTFVRGFVRNYARLVQLDAEKVLGALPGGTAAPALESPTLHPTTHTMGELPTTTARRRRGRAGSFRCACRDRRRRGDLRVDAARNRIACRHAKRCRIRAGFSCPCSRPLPLRRPPSRLQAQPVAGTPVPNPVASAARAD